MGIITSRLENCPKGSASPCGGRNRKSRSGTARLARIPRRRIRSLRLEQQEAPGEDSTGRGSAEVQAAEKLKEARVGAQGVEHGIDAQARHFGVVLFHGLLEPVEGHIFIAQSGVSGGDAPGGAVGSLAALQLSLENPAIHGEWIGGCGCLVEGIDHIGSGVTEFEQAKEFCCREILLILLQVGPGEIDVRWVKIRVQLQSALERGEG